MKTRGHSYRNDGGQARAHVHVHDPARSLGHLYNFPQKQDISSVSVQVMQNRHTLTTLSSIAYTQNPKQGNIRVLDLRSQLANEQQQPDIHHLDVGSTLANS